MKAIVKNEFNFKGQTSHYVGKVRDVYSIGDDYLVMVVLFFNTPKTIPL